MSEKEYVLERLRSFRFAWNGFRLLLRTEANVQVHFLALAIIVIAGYSFSLTPWEWCAQLLAAGLVIGMEMINTAIEKLCDFVQPEKDPQIGAIKDISAAAVFWSAFVAVVVAALIYIPKL